MDNEKRKQVIRYLTCWGLLLLSLVLFPSLSWPLLTYRILPDTFGQLLFFWPQYLFLPNGLTHEATIGERVYADGSAMYAAILFWIAAVAVYVWSTRRIRAALAYLGFIPVLYLITQCGIYLVLALFGFGVVLDGP